MTSVMQPSFPRPALWVTARLCALLMAAMTAAAHAEEFFVVRHGWHSGIVVARADIPPGTLPPGVVARDFAGCRCLEFGWGDRSFYTAPKPTVPMALRAALIPGPSVLHVAGFTLPPARTHQWAETVAVRCTHEEFAALCRSLGETFARDAAGRAKAGRRFVRIQEPVLRGAGQVLVRQHL